MKLKNSKFSKELLKNSMTFAKFDKGFIALLQKLWEE